MAAAARLRRTLEYASKDHVYIQRAHASICLDKRLHVTFVASCDFCVLRTDECMQHSFSVCE